MSDFTNNNVVLLLSVSIGQVIPLIFMAVGVILLFYASTRRLAGKVGLTEKEAANRIPALREHIEIKERLEKLLVELQDLAREINAHIDTRFCKLQVLIKEADEKIKKLETLNKSIGTKDRIGQEPNKDTSEDKSQENINPEHRLIYELADKGLSPTEIAKNTDKTPGEIELILALRRTKREKQNNPHIDYRIED